MDIAQKTLQLKQDFDDVYEAGKKAESDAFWDGFQDYGNRKDYNQGFKNWAGAATINPKYPIVTLNISELFRNCPIVETVPKVFSTNTDGTFGMCNMGFYGCSNLKSVDFDIIVSGTNTNAWQQSFYNCTNLQCIKKIGVLESQVFNKTFEYCGALENIDIEGTIGQNGFDIHWSTKLSAESIDSIVRALSPNTTGLTVTLPAGAYETHATTYGAPNTAVLWESKSNWTINELAV